MFGVDLDDAELHFDKVKLCLVSAESKHYLY